MSSSDRSTARSSTAVARTRPPPRSRFASVVVAAAGAVLISFGQGGVAHAAVTHAGAAGRRAAHTAVAHAGVADRRAATAAPAGPDLTRAPATPPTPYQDSMPYYEVSPDGAVWPQGGAVSHGQLSAAALGTSVVGVTLTHDGGGYWLVTANGRVQAYGDAVWHGSPYRSRIAMVPVGLVADSGGGGYWVYGADGQVTAFGDAGSFGSLVGGAPIVDAVATPDGGGYWLLGANGAVTPFGDAAWHGGEGRRHIAQQFVGMAATADGLGYWLVTSTGGVYPQGDATWSGSLGRHPIGQPIASVVATSDGRGYWLVAHDGDLHPFGDANNQSPPIMAFVHTVLTPGDRAVEWAMDQLGKPYAWGGTGPDAFDCSGLTMEAWSAAGVAIPRIAADQYIYEPHVAIPNLVDGDLVFWASNYHAASIYHVGMYLGGGHMVNAPYTGQVVRSDWMGGYQFVREGAAP